MPLVASLVFHHTNQPLVRLSESQPVGMTPTSPTSWGAPRYNWIKISHLTSWLSLPHLVVTLVKPINFSVPLGTTWLTRLATIIFQPVISSRYIPTYYMFHNKASNQFYLPYLDFTARLYELYAASVEEFGTMTRSGGNRSQVSVDGAGTSCRRSGGSKNMQGYSS